MRAVLRTAPPCVRVGSEGDNRHDRDRVGSPCSYRLRSQSVDLSLKAVTRSSLVLPTSSYLTRIHSSSVNCTLFTHTFSIVSFLLTAVHAHLVAESFKLSHGVFRLVCECTSVCDRIRSDRVLWGAAGAPEDCKAGQKSQSFRRPTVQGMT